MQSTRTKNRFPAIRACLCAWLCCVSLPLAALQSDRQQPLEVNANSTDGTLGDGITKLRGDVVIRQGSLLIKAEEAEVSKVDGRVNTVIFKGGPASLEQEIEEQGMVRATAKVINYQVANGLVTLTGSADVTHPQYQISGELLTYDLNHQRFEGSADDHGNGRIHIRLDPEVIDENLQKPEKEKGAPTSEEPPVKDPGMDGS